LGDLDCHARSEGNGAGRVSLVTLMSGGLDSTLMAVLALESGVAQHPLFVNYGQRSLKRELAACRRAIRSWNLPKVKVADVAGFGNLIKSGLTDPTLHVMEDAFTPGRNMLFLLVAASYAYTVGADGVAIGLLDEDTSLFPDQTSTFLTQAEIVLRTCLGRPMNVVAPLAVFHKRDVVRMATKRGIESTYSCHSGKAKACGVCIACREFGFKEE
jgi:7-cyano-7-deazaguanine synthase